MTLVAVPREARALRQSPGLFAERLCVIPGTQNWQERRWTTHRKQGMEFER
jgi:hypothetical protein